MFDNMFLKRLKKMGIFALIYTVIFVLFIATFSYTFPFVVAIVIALIMKPVTRFLMEKFKLSRGISSLVSTLALFILAMLIVTTIVFKITVEIKQLVVSLPSIDDMMKYIHPYINKLKEYYDTIDPSIVGKVQTQLTSIFSGGLDITMRIVNRVVSFAISLPMVAMMLFITFLATFFITRDIGGFSDKFMSMFSKQGKENVRKLWDESIIMIVGYIKSYSILLTMTFVESWIGFSILGVKYALILSIFCAIFDILPILGIGAVYTPLVIIFLLRGKYFMAIGVVVLYVIVTIIRQILEPKLVSASLGIHPVAVLAAIFIGIKAYGFVGMIYLISLMVLYNILKKVEFI